MKSDEIKKQIEELQNLLDSTLKKEEEENSLTSRVDNINKEIVSIKESLSELLKKDDKEEKKGVKI